jgi:hypothetical protein
MLRRLSWLATDIGLGFGLVAAAECNRIDAAVMAATTAATS